MGSCRCNTEANKWSKYFRINVRISLAVSTVAIERTILLCITTIRTSDSHKALCFPRKKISKFQKKLKKQKKMYVSSNDSFGFQSSVWASKVYTWCHWFQQQPCYASWMAFKKGSFYPGMIKPNLGAIGAPGALQLMQRCNACLVL